MATTVAFDSRNLACTIGGFGSNCTETGARKDARQVLELQGKLIDRAQQLLARAQTADGRNLGAGGEIKSLASDALRMGREILSSPPPTNQYIASLRAQGVLSAGIVTMAAVMLLLQEHSNSTFEAMQTKTTASRDAQEMANRVKTVLAKLTKPNDTGELPQDVIKYMGDNKILVDGKTIDEFISGKSKKINQGDLKAVEMALESASNRASDFVQQVQLKLQQMMQAYNTAVQMTNSLQSMLAESVKSIASSIR